MELKHRIELNFNNGWLFCKGNLDGAEKIEFDDTCFRKQDLPHDYAIEGGFQREGKSSQGFLDRWYKAWYRKHFKYDLETNKKVHIYFDGIMSNSEVFINGISVGSRPYGYVPFYYDITNYLCNGENVIAVSVDNSQPPADRWYSGAGIYRNVKLIITENEHIDIFGTYITSKVEANEALANLQITLTGGDTVNTKIFSPSNELIAGSESIIDNNIVHQSFGIPDAKRWDIDSPNLYVAYSVIYKNGRPVDDYITTFGIRDIFLDNQKGLILNGKCIKLKGVNLHHDGGCVGSAVPVLIWKRRLKVLKEIGCNSIRCSHNPPASEFLDLCDEMGFLVIDEAFDKWTWEPGYYIKVFYSWWKKDLEAMILRDRNHPSIFMWSVGNEVEKQGSPEMLEKLKMLTDFTKEIEPSRPVTYVMEPHCNIAPDLEMCNETPIEVKVEITKNIAKCVDVLCCNYQEQWYEHYRKAIPNKLIIGSETYLYFRGNGTEFLAHKEISPWFDVTNNDFVAGQYIWPGIDYLGESVNESVRGWTGGLIDMAGFKKPAAYFYQSLWSEKPMVYACVLDNSRNYYWSKSMQGHWSWPNVTEGWNFQQFTDSTVMICVYTNCEVVEIKLNGKTKARVKKADFPNGIIHQYKHFLEGECEVVGFINNVEVCKHTLTTAYEPETIELDCVENDGQYAILECCIKDKNGNIASHMDRDIVFDVKGDGYVVGSDNGDMYDFTAFSSNCRRTFLGKSMIVVKLNGNVDVYAHGIGLRGTCLLIR